MFLKDPGRREVLISMGSVVGAFAAGPVAALTRDAFGQDEKRATLRVMSYNIAQGVGTDGVYDLQRVAKVIAAVDPDVLALQEVEDQNRASWRSESLSNYDAQHELLSEWLGMEHCVFAANRDWQQAEVMASWTDEEKQAGYRRRMGDVVLSKKPIVRSAVHEFETNTRFRPPFERVQGRKLTELLLDVDGAPLWFYNTHLQPGSGEIEIERRSKQVEELLEIASKRSGPKILAGDFNFPDGRHGWRKESFRTPRDYNTVTGSYIDVLRQADADTATAGIPPLGWGPVRFDYIFATEDIGITSGRTIRYAAEPEGPLPSDHRPIFADITIPGAQRSGSTEKED